MEYFDFLGELFSLGGCHPPLNNFKIQDSFIRLHQVFDCVDVILLFGRLSKRLKGVVPDEAIHQQSRNGFVIGPLRQVP